MLEIRISWKILKNIFGEKYLVTTKYGIFFSQKKIKNDNILIQKVFELGFKPEQEYFTKFGIKKIVWLIGYDVNKQPIYKTNFIELNSYHFTISK